MRTTRLSERIASHEGGHLELAIYLRQQGGTERSTDPSGKGVLVLQAAGLPSIITEVLDNQELQRCASPKQVAHSPLVGGLDPKRL